MLRTKIACPLPRAAVFSWLLSGAVILLAISLPARTARAQEVAEQAATADAEEAVRPTLELGKFKIHDLRPTRNETAKSTFAMHLALSPTLSPQQVTQLARWQHRLRDQVIIAIRTLELKEFQEPDLRRLRRKVLLRVNRLFQAKLAEEVLLTEYLFRTN
jgi:flagellar FliL protein